MTSGERRRGEKESLAGWTKPSNQPDRTVDRSEAAVELSIADSEDLQERSAKGREEEKERHGGKGGKEAKKKMRKKKGPSHVQQSFNQSFWGAGTIGIHSVCHSLGVSIMLHREMRLSLVHG